MSGRTGINTGYDAGRMTGLNAGHDAGKTGDVLPGTDKRVFEDPENEKGGE